MSVCEYGLALTELLAAIRYDPTVTWTKPDGRANTYRTLHQGALSEWMERWGHLLEVVHPT